MAAFYDKFPIAQAVKLEIYHVAQPSWLWEIPTVKKSKEDRKAEAEASARDIYQRLRALPDAPNNAEWVRRAGVSTSFFTNLGAGKKPPSDPSINNLRLVLRAIGRSIPELLLHEADGRVVQAPSRQDVEQAFRDALPDLPGTEERQSEYLTEVVLQLLSLPDQSRAIPESDDQQATVEPGESPAARASTKRA